MRFGGALYQIIKRIKPENELEYLRGITDQLVRFAEDCKCALKGLGIQVYLVTLSKPVRLF